MYVPYFIVLIDGWLDLLNFVPNIMYDELRECGKNEAYHTYFFLIWSFSCYADNVAVSIVH